MTQATVTPDDSNDVLPGGMLLETKLHVPPARPRQRVVSRPRLLEQLTEGRTRRLTLLSAPAGYGKTTLLGEWLGTCPCHATWISLDAGDNDLARFIGYLVAALSKIVPAAGDKVREAVRTSGSLPIEPILAVLINEIAAVKAAGDPSLSPCVLVLDDYHMIDTRAIHEAITFLIDHLPSQLNVIIATRVDPPLPLARWRSRGQMVEIRADDLRFDDDEAAFFLNQVMQLDLLPGDMTALAEHTEGWVVGLQMAALSLRGRPAERVAAFVRTFSGSHRYILDYLVEEVLGYQPDDVQSFLVQTSVLERLTGPLCEAVTEQSGGQGMLERLERANLFLVPLDDERRWYRYHHLFVELLRARLQQSQPDSLPLLHSRAAEWYERNGQVAEAVSHALAAQDFERAVPLIESSAIGLLSRGETTTLLSWVRALPEEIVFDRPLLCVTCAWILAFTGSLDQTKSLLCAAERRLEQDEPTAGTQSLLGQIAAIRSAAANTRGEGYRAIEIGCLALELLPPHLLRARGVVLSTLGHAYSAQGDLERAEWAYRKFAEIGEALDQVWTLVQAKCELAELRKIQGRLGQADELYREALQSVAEKSQQRLGTAGMVAVGLSDLLRERNDLEAAEGQLIDAIQHLPWATYMRWWESPNPLAAGYVTLARVLWARGRLDEAMDAIQQAAELSRAYDVQPDIRALIEACQVRLWLARGALATVARWQEERGLGAGETLDPAYEATFISLARVLLARGRLDEAERLLTRLAAAAEAGGRRGRQIEILVLQALALAETADRKYAQGKATHALVALGKALTLAEPEGYVRVFLDEDRSMAELLRLGRRRGLWSEERLGAYVDKLLALLEPELESQRPLAEQSLFVSAGPFPLVEPLSERELEVLRLIANGLSNQEIADELILATGTVKAHAHNIYGKLGVRGRTQAIARARELGLF